MKNFLTSGFYGNSAKTSVTAGPLLYVRRDLAEKKERAFLQHVPPSDPILSVCVDLMNGTPIYDIKPYITYTDCVPDAVQGFAEEYKNYALNVDFPQELLDRIPKDKQSALIGILRHDPRPAYQNTPNRIYGVRYMNFDVHFKVKNDTLTVTDINTI